MIKTSVDASLHLMSCHTFPFPHTAYTLYMLLTTEKEVHILPTDLANHTLYTTALEGRSGMR